MADSRLRWTQVAAPDLSGASRILTNANNSFNSAFDTADSVLARYAEGQQEKADNELLTEIASISDEAELGKFLSSGALQGRNISKAMQNRVLDLRNTVLGYGKDRAGIDYTRASTRNTDARTGIALAGEGRTAAEYADGVAKRNAERALGQAFATSYNTARGQGFTPVPGVTENTRLMLARTLQAEAGNQGFQGMLDVGSVIRNRAADSKGQYGQGIEGVIMKPGQFSAWNSVTGYANGEQGQNMDFTPNAEALAAADAILSGQYQDGTNGATHYYNPSISQPNWGNDSFVKRGDHVFGFGNGRPNPAPRQPVDAAGQIALSAASTGLFTPAEISGFQAPIIEAQKGGEARNRRLKDERAAEVSADALIAAAQDVDNTNTKDVVQDLLAPNSELTAVETLNLARNAPGVLEQLPGVVTPSVVTDPAIADAVEQAQRQDTLGLTSSEVGQLLSIVPDFREDPVGTLMQRLSLGQDDPNNPGWFFGAESGFDRNQLDNMITDIARENQVSREIAAAAMAQEFQRDPTTFFGFNRNTLENRFPKEAIAERISIATDQDRVNQYTSDRDTVSARAERLKVAEQNLVRLQQRATKYTQQNQRVPLELAAAIAQLQAEILAAPEDIITRAPGRNNNR